MGFRYPQTIALDFFSVSIEGGYFYLIASMQFHISTFLITSNYKGVMDL